MALLAECDIFFAREFRQANVEIGITKRRAAVSEGYQARKYPLAMGSREEKFKKLKVLMRFRHAQGEAHVFDGTGSQLDTSHRWGDYSSMAIDPVDDRTFWYTTEYYDTNSTFNWRTRIGNFHF
jgi:hypothetical protein